VHGLHSQSPEIVDADPIYLVWKRFKSWLDLYLQLDDDGVLVAWNGETCDLTWLWRDYAENYAAVDRNDHNSADYSTSMRTNRLYFHIFFWPLDRVIHMMFVICCNLAQKKRGPHLYQKYLKKDGRFKFQIDLGIALLNHALANGLGK
jgi:hypothetical protein